MPVETINDQQLAMLFSVFHDGVFCDVVQQGDTLQFDIDIRYLAARVNPLFSKFHIMLAGVEELTFITWPDDVGSNPTVFTDISAIFTPRLELLSAEVSNDMVKISCNQPLAGLGYCGGDLKIKATSVVVKDEAGTAYSIDELQALNDGYWDEWGS